MSRAKVNSFCVEKKITAVPLKKKLTDKVNEDFETMTDLCGK